MGNDADLNQRQTQILDYIKEKITPSGYPPSVREIGQAVGLKSSSTVHAYLLQLEEKGFLRR
ncbi:MAG: helix-turn-helix domain-containing protein, partial [Syntrophomonas sp.]